MVIPSRLLAFSLLGFVMMLAIGCAGRAGTAQPQELSDARPVAEQNPFAGANEPDPRVDPFARTNEYDAQVDPFAGTNEPDHREVAGQTPAPAPSSPPETQSDEPHDPLPGPRREPVRSMIPWSR